MWVNVFTWVLGLLTLAVSADWLTRRSTRSLRRIRAEAEIAALLPEGDAKAAMDDSVQSAVQAYLRRRDREQGLPRRIVTLGPALALCGYVVAYLVAVVPSGGSLDESDPKWVVVPAVIAIVLGVVGILWMVVRGVRDFRELRTVRRELRERREQGER